MVTGATGLGGAVDPKGVEENEKLILLSPVVMLQMLRQEVAPVRKSSQVNSQCAYVIDHPIYHRVRRSLNQMHAQKSGGRMHLLSLGHEECRGMGKAVHACI